jgi:predicted Zn-dependent peptidase
MADVVQRPAFSVAEVERQRAARLGDLAAQRGDAAAVAAVAGHAALVVAGDIGLADLKALAAAQFGAWPQAGHVPAMPGTPAPTAARVVLVDKPGAGQAALRITSMGDAPLSAQELDKARNALVLALPGQFDTNRPSAPAWPTVSFLACRPTITRACRPGSARSTRPACTPWRAST